MKTSAKLKKYIELLKKCKNLQSASQVFVYVIADTHLNEQEKKIFGELYEAKTEDLPDIFEEEFLKDIKA